MISFLRPFAFSVFLCFSLLSCDGGSQTNNPKHVVNLLVDLLNDPSPDVRRTAALSLGKMAHPDGEPALLGALDDTDSLVREYSAWALGQVGENVSDQTVLPLVKVLGDEVAEVKAAAAHALTMIGIRPMLIELLIEALSVAEVHTRRVIVQSLAGLDAPLAYPALLAALHDEDARVRQGAVSALGELGDRRALPALRKRLLHDPDQGVRTEAAFRLGKLGDETDIASLRKAAQTDPTPIVHLWASWALQEIEGPVE